MAAVHRLMNRCGVCEELIEGQVDVVQWKHSEGASRHVHLAHDRCELRHPALHWHYIRHFRSARILRRAVGNCVDGSLERVVNQLFGGASS